MTGETNKILIYDFKKSKPLMEWYVVNDNVMGGYSNGSISKNKMVMEYLLEKYLLIITEVLVLSDIILKKE
tara:strand:+ start:511 stop:723 length:213 start_codon:yes stop_codon:yes gene_type:complete